MKSLFGIVLSFLILLLSPESETFCSSSLAQRDCAAKEVLVRGENGCPECRGGLTLQQNCTNLEEACTPGLLCNPSGRSRTCQLDRNRTSCWYTRHLNALVTLLPKCSIDGVFEQLQCKGDTITGRCFCSAEDGKPIFGWGWWRDAEDMTCACSAWRHKLEESEVGNVYFHCEQNGNFEPLQCANDICYCADPKTGMVKNGTVVVPASWWRFLPCYNKAEHGDFYPRKCESVLFGLDRIRKVFALHGTTDVSTFNIKCGFDGAFGDHVIENGIIYCTSRDGKKIGTYSGTIEDVTNIDCSCASDKVHFQTAGVEHTLACLASGAYRPLQERNGEFFCVDLNGFAASPLLLAPPQDCTRYFYYAT